MRKIPTPRPQEARFFHKPLELWLEARQSEWHYYVVFDRQRGGIPVMAQPAEPSVVRTLLIVAGAVVLPVVFVAAGLLLLRGAKWMQAKAYAIAVVGVVALMVYGIMAVDAWREGQSAVAIAGYAVVGVVWLLFGSWQYRLRKKAPKRAS
jgi:hypothetical protein